jgi:molecular chaperone GrpE
MTKNLNNHPSEDEEDVEKLISHPSYEELMQKLDEADKKANENWERLLRLQAEMDNLQRRHERELSNAHKFSLEKFVSALLPIVDSLELSIGNVTKGANKDIDTIIEGEELTLKLLYSCLEKFGVEQVNPLNQPFDPEFQQAISMQVDATVKPGMVIGVLQKGYTLNNRLVRPALVIVSKTE